ncbi:hypothetical protein ACFYPB_01570 [Streptomyces olivaceoviridis]|uniref:hypothetical protein n=1 Tax=Streptomyces olivaceoviridis TaxID=1921 RepID=UPI00368360EE
MDQRGTEVEPLMPADPVRGQRGADQRRTLEAIAYRTALHLATIPIWTRAAQRDSTPRR